MMINVANNMLQLVLSNLLPCWSGLCQQYNTNFIVFLKEAFRHKFARINRGSYKNKIITR